MNVSIRVKDLLNIIFVNNKKQDDIIYGGELMNYAKREADISDQKMLQTLGKVMYLHLDADNKENPFAHNLEILSPEELEALKQNFYDIEHLRLKARIADILWIKGSYVHAKVAIDTYLQLADIVLDAIEWPLCFKYIKRAFMIAKSLGKGGAEFTSKCIDYINTKIFLLDGKDPLFLSLKLIELILDDPATNPSAYLPIINNIIAAASMNHETHRMEDAFEIKTKLLKRIKGKDADIKKIQMDLAHYYEDEAKSKNDPFHVKIYYEKAIQIYKCYRLYDDLKRLQHILEPIEKALIKDVVKHTSTIEFDINVIQNEIEARIESCTFEEKVIFFSNSATFYTRDMLQEIIMKEKKNVYQALATQIILDEEGRTIKTLPPLGISDSTDESSHYDHLHKKAFMLECMNAIKLSCCLTLIRRDHNFDENSFDFFLKDNILILNKQIVKRGIFRGLQGYYFEALSLLIPQVESFFRNLVKLCGGIVTKYEKDEKDNNNNLVEEFASLDTILNSKELKDCYDPDTLFIFQGLLCEKSGANLRNRLAHALINDDGKNDEIIIFFLAAFMKIISYYAPGSLET